MLTNLHTHSTWCDGKSSPEEMVQAAIRKGFSTLGFSSHAMLPQDDIDWVLTLEKAPRYAAEIRALKEKYKGAIEILCGVEADYIPGGATPCKEAYAAIRPDYIIGSIHWVKATDGALVAVDHTPQILADGIRDHFGGNAEALIRAYFAAEREMVRLFDFDILGHPDLVRKFNMKNPYFDESAAWYQEELVQTADVIAASGKIVEVNTGAIARGWLDDAYPAPSFRKLLRERGVKFILSSDAHTSDTLDCAFDRFSCADFTTDDFFLYTFEAKSFTPR